MRYSWQKFSKDQHGQVGAIMAMVSTIFMLLIAVIIVYQVTIAPIGPTDNTGHWENEDNHEQGAGWIPNPNYSASALAAYNNVKTLGWAGITLMSIVIIVLAGMTLMSVFSGGGFGRRGP